MEQKLILLIGHALDHPDGTHLYLPTLMSLGKSLEKNPGIETQLIDGWPEDSLMDQADAIVLYGSPGAEICYSQDHQSTFEKTMHRGAGLTAIHWSTGVYEENIMELGDKWKASLGGFWMHHSGAQVDSAYLKMPLADHAIYRGWEPLLLQDEFYLNPVLGDNSKSLLEVDLDENNLMVAWCNTRISENNGRSFGTTLGHFASNFEITGFRRLMVNGILWTAQVKIPHEGAIL